jgi:hypothetical protein
MVTNVDESDATRSKANNNKKINCEEQSQRVGSARSRAKVRGRGEEQSQGAWARQAAGLCYLELSRVE